MTQQISQPERIASYKILGKLGQGAMGVVYKAAQEQLGRQVALKVLPSQFANDKKFCERFVREAKAAASVVHPNVVTCYDAGHDNGQWYMALEFVAGGDADAVIKKSKHHQLSETVALGIIRDCARGLVAIHEAHLVHRDIKPANIFITKEGSAKLADLGLAFSTDDADRLTMPGSVMGSPAYMPPEQARGDDEIDIRADIYGLGATFYHLCCGQPPFTGHTALITLQQVLHDNLKDPRTFNDNLSDNSVAIMKMALEKDRERRYASPQQLLDDLECALHGRPLMHARSESKRRASDNREAAKKASKLEEQQQQDEQTICENVTNAEEAPASVEIKDESPKPKRETLGIKPQKKLDARALDQLAKRIRVNKLGTLAWLSLAPQASFPREVLLSMLDHLSISYGLDQGALNEATRSSEIARRIVLARGDDPSPGFPGRSVYDTPVDPLEERIVIRKSRDNMSAYALFVPNVLLDKNEVKRAIVAAHVRFGIDIDAVHRLSDGPPDPSGRLLIARGRKGRPGRAAGFVLVNRVMNTSVDDVASANFQKVHKGDVIATWEEGEASETGMDVSGHPRTYPPLQEKKPEDWLGDGVEYTRSRDGQVVLKATVTGICQLQSHGQIRVVNAVEYNGALTMEEGSVKTNELLIVRGDIEDGVEVESGSDVVIMGDLKNAKIRTSGSVIVDGIIEAGDESIVAAGTIEADGMEVRRVMAGSVCIRGEVTNCELIATGDISVDRVVGGRLCAGGKITALDAGDETGVTTEIWAGHNLDYGEQKEFAEIEERKLAHSRQQVLEKQREIDQQLDQIEAKKLRLEGAAFVKDGQDRALKQELEHLKRKQDRLQRDSEEMRGELGQRRQSIQELGGLHNNEDAEIIVKNTAHKGVIFKLANTDAEILKRVEKEIHRHMKPDED